MENKKIIYVSEIKKKASRTHFIIAVNTFQLWFKRETPTLLTGVQSKQNTCRYTLWPEGGARVPSVRVSAERLGLSCRPAASVAMTIYVHQSGRMQVEMEMPRR